MHRVLMTKINFRLRREGFNFVIQGVIHLLRTAFEQATAATAKEGVTGKKSILNQIADTAGGMTGGMQDLSGDIADPDLAPVGQGTVHSRDPSSVALVTIDSKTGKFSTQIFQATDMIGMVMGTVYGLQM